MSYARGSEALGRCGRCGDKVSYSSLVSDGHIPGFRVCPHCRDTKHPSEKPFRTDESIALRHPAPDNDDDSAGAGGSLGESLFPGETYFGGGT